MTDTQDTAQRFPGAQLLGQLSEVEYIQVHAVLTVRGDEIRYHGPVDAWPGSPEAQAIALEAAIAAKSKELDALLLQRGQVHALGDIRSSWPAAVAADAEEPAKKKRRFRRWRCLKCGEVCGNLGTHGKYNHPGVPLEELRGEEVGEGGLEAPSPAEMAPGGPERDAEPPAPAEAGTATPPTNAPGAEMAPEAPSPAEMAAEPPAPAEAGTATPPTVPAATPGTEQRPK